MNQQQVVFPEQKNQFDIHNLQHLCKHLQGSTGRAYSINRYEIIWLKSGSAALNINLQQLNIGDHSILCLGPGHLLQIDPDCKVNGYYLSLSSDFFHLASQDHSTLLSPLLTLGLHALNNPLVIKLSAQDEVEIEDILHKMQLEFSNHYALRQQVLTGWLKIFLLYLSRQQKIPVYTSLVKRDTELSRRFMQLLTDGRTPKKQVADYAAELMVTPNYLNQAIKRNSGHTASYHIQQRVVLEAKRQAMQSTRSMKEIAYNLGFDDTAHFSKFFKQNSGVNFTAFKRACI